MGGDGSAPAPDWYPDPTRRHGYRYWDGAQWTDQVRDAGRQTSDPPTMPNEATPDWSPDPTRRHGYRYWDGAQWTDQVRDAGRQKSDPPTMGDEAAPSGF